MQGWLKHVWDTKHLNNFSVECSLDKADRMRYGQSAMNHAMVFTAVDLDEKEKPKKWRVENSWGDKFGKNGYHIMTDDWFSEYTYQAVLGLEDLPPEKAERVSEILRSKPFVLPPWDPMGTLAHSKCITIF